MEVKATEPAKIPPSIEILKKNQGHPLLWFLKDLPEEKLRKLQYEQRTESVRLSESLSLEVDLETLGQEIITKLNEDHTLVLPMGEGRTAYAVIDGVSSKVTLAGLPEGISGGFYISHLISLGFPKSQEYQDLLAKTIPPSAKEIVVIINQWIGSEFERQKIKGLDYSIPESVPGVSITLALIDGQTEKFHLADIADTMAIGKTKEGRYKMLTRDQNAIFDQKVMDWISQKADETSLSIKDVINSQEHSPTVRRLLLEASKEKINKPSGCGILNGQKELVTNNLIEEHEYDINDFDDLWIVSDGAMLAFPEVIALLLSKPEGVTEQELREVLTKIREENKIPPVFESLVLENALILEKDPERRRVPRFKDQDDATIIRIKINAGKRQVS